ncbi:MAG TPA: SDR family oxidoreductase [Micromonosporaceae bacterium]|nr:SDR family oxidoreductase [Micromonosporaceae bacterium]
MDLELAGRAYYVTGGSRGVGRAVVRRLLAEGARVATCARNEAGLAELTRATSPAHRDQLVTQRVDVRDAPALRAAVAEAVARLGRLDGVVVNAGAGSPGRALATPPEVFAEQFDIKIRSALATVHAALDSLRRSDSGRVVVINGVTARAPEPEMAAVSASRAALLNLARSLAVELAPDRILVNAVNLGVILTGRQRARYAAAASTVPFEQWCGEEAARRGALLGRMGTPEEVAPIVALLLSPLSSYVTGAFIDVAGGGGGGL